MSGGNIKVVVRVRPFNSREVARNAKCIVQMRDSQTVLTAPGDADERLRKGSDGGQKIFAFDRSYWSFSRDDAHYAGQENLHADLGVPLLDNAFQGYNNCIFAYGQTGSGKSYSMMGYGPEAGIIPKICQDMFERIGKIQADRNLQCTVEVSYLEIYNERVRDLLNPSTKGNLKVREHPSTGPYVEDLAKLVVRSFPEIESLMDEGNKARTVAATNMNETSSRSHAVFTLTLTQKRHDEETRMDTEKVAKISLVDLAGSERATSTGATGARLKEGAEINRSLSTLGRVIAALADLSSGKRKGQQVPYRDSVLTWLLKDSLGGNSLTAMIAAISPADINFEETLSTLRYADSAKRIKNHAVVNEDPNARMIRELKEELAQLRSKLSGATGGIPEEQYAPDTPLEQQIVSIVQPDGSIKKVSKADIAEQLSQSEKLYDDLNQTWEQKLLKTEAIHKEREAALEELGISIEKGFVGLSTPKKMPHLVNLSDDPLLAECLVYNLKPGTTMVGNVDDPSTHAEIRLNGVKILKEHCIFENTDGTVTVIPGEGAAVMVNGVRTDKPKRLRSGNRLILGDFHIFRFNHPQEARAERAEQSLLRHSVTTSQLGSPSPRAHDRSISKAGSDVETDGLRAESPHGRDLDWSFARREAAGAMLGGDAKISLLTDEELDALFNDVQRARAVRHGRPESRLHETNDDDEHESVSSYPVREKYLSNGTIDNFSLDTALTIPSTPRVQGEDEHQSNDEKLRTVRDNMQVQLDKQKEDFQEQLRAAEASSHNVEELKEEKQRMEEALATAKEEFQAQLKRQKDEFQVQLTQMQRPHVVNRGVVPLSDEEKRRAFQVVERWRRLRSRSLAEAILKHAALLKEAQVMSQIMDKNVFFQFAVLDHGQDAPSSYDLVLNGISGEDDMLETLPKPCIAIRVVDFQHSIIHFWSLDKLERRVHAMRQMHQYLDRPDYMQHLGLENPFVEPFLSQYSLIGDAHVPLTAVFEARVQDYTVQVTSPHTQQSIGTVKLSVEPSSAEAPASMLKFNVVLHEMAGFAEREGTAVHAQMFLPGISDEGATTTQMISDFDEAAIRFESVHSMSVPQESPKHSRLHIAVFARVTSMHLDKLLSWDDMREATTNTPTTKKQQAKARLSEREYYVEEQHDVFAKVQILEMSEAGDYQPVEVEQSSSVDSGTYQLRQGLQRRIAVSLVHSSTGSLQWQEICSMRVGNIHLLDPWGKSADRSISSDLPLNFIHTPSIAEASDGSTHISVTSQWDSSLHDSILLDRPTADRYRVALTISLDATSQRTSQPLTFAIATHLQIRPRSWIRAQSMFKQLWRAARIVHSTTAIFSITLKPTPSKRSTDLWRLDSHHQYVKGEETLTHWAPRGISLIHDFLMARRLALRVSAVEATKVYLARHASPAAVPPSLDSSVLSLASTTASTIASTPAPSTSDSYTAAQTSLLTRILSLWRTTSPSSLLPSALPSLASLTTPPATPPPSTARPRPLLTPVIHTHSKTSTALHKAGPVLVPAPDGTRWLRRHAELRPPYLHLYSVPEGDEVALLSLRAATVDPAPPLASLLRSERVGARNVWAVYAAGGSWLMACRDDGARAEWVDAVERAFARPEEGDEDEVW